MLAQQTQQPRLDPRQTEKTFDAFVAEQKRAARANLRVPKFEQAKTNVDSKPLFKLTAVSIEGATAVPSDLIAETYRPYIGTTVSQADLVAIANKISEQYRKAGYHLSRAIVPVQDIRNGRVRVKVIEGKIGEIAVKGDDTDRFRVRSLLYVITAEHPSQLKTLERSLLLVNERPGVRIADTALEEIGVATGNFRLIIEVETWRIYVAVGIDNWGPSAAGPLQSYLLAAFNSYFIAGDTLGIELSTIPDATRELRFSRLFYDVPVGTDGARFGAIASYGETQPGDERRQLADRAFIESFEFRGSITPLQTQQSSLRLTATAGFTNESDADMLATNYKDRVRTIGIIADAQMRDDFGGWNYLTTGIHQGLNIFDASQKGDLLTSRINASAQFTRLDFSFSRIQKLSEEWSLKLSAVGQWASGPLLSSQKFYLGGAAFGRGYDSGEVSGDDGIAGSLELRFDRDLKGAFF